MTISNTTIKNWMEAALRQKKNIKETILSDKIWNITLYMNGNGNRPYLWFKVSFAYKNGLNGRTRFDLTNEPIHKLEENLYFRNIPAKVNIRKDIINKMQEVSKIFVQLCKG